MGGAVAGVGLLVLGGCVPLPRGHVLERRLVVAKEGEATLVSDDGARCPVDAGTFAKVNVGDEHACVWKHGETGGATAPGVPGARVPSAPGVRRPPDRAR